MANDYKTYEYKQRVISRLQKIEYENYSLERIDERLYDYVFDCLEDPEAHNLYELLEVERFFKRCELFSFDPEPFELVKYLESELKFTTTEGPQQIHLTPVQVFQFVNILCFFELCGNGDDIRRAVRQAIIFIPRKFGKTTEVVLFAIMDFLFGEDNAQTYVLSNSERQAKILFGEIKAVLERRDTRNQLRFRAADVHWNKRAFTKNNPQPKHSFIEALSGNPKTKDGLFASMWLYDEYGAASYVKDHSDGASLLQVVDSSMGPRKEPLGIVITTAGRVVDGPFQQMLEGAKEALRNQDSLWQFAHIFCPDEYEYDDAFYALPSVWKKCQPHLGITVQADYYARKWEEAQQNPESYLEFVTKMLNVFHSDNVVEWKNPEEMRKLVVKCKVDDLDPREGWWCLIGMDFSKGNDLNAQAYLCFHPERKEFFLDCDAWITEDCYKDATKNPLYKKWVDDGWLRLSPNGYIDENLILKRVMEVEEHVNIIRIGYDSYDAQRFVNLLSAWVAEHGVAPNTILRPVKQTNGAFNASVQEFDYLYNKALSDIKEGNEPKFTISENPLIPWCFGNCFLDEDPNNENVKPIKKNVNQKIDIAICTLECLIMLDDAQINL